MPGAPCRGSALSPTWMCRRRGEHHQLAAGQTILLKLDDLLRQLRRCHPPYRPADQHGWKSGGRTPWTISLARHRDFAAIVALTEPELRACPIRGGEAWLALYHRKTSRTALRLILATPTDRFVPDHPPRRHRTDQADSQRLHAPRSFASTAVGEIEFADERELSIAILRALQDLLPGAIERITRLVSRHTAADFLGRDKELTLLDDAWNGKPRHHKSSPSSPGAALGKTALLAYWVQSRFVAKDWLNASGQPGPDAYFDWTFYDQGTRGDDATHAGAASVGTFFQTALKHFGDPEPERPHEGARAWPGGSGAALRSSRGLEPLQYPLNHPQAGQLTDPDLRELLGLLCPAQSRAGHHLQPPGPHRDSPAATHYAHPPARPRGAARRPAPSPC